jgi:uncharacterized protein
VRKALADAAAGDLAAVRQLLRAQPDAARHWQPLMNAAFGGLAAFVDLLLELGAPVGLADAAMLYDLPSMHRRLAAEPALVATRDAAGRRPLHALAASGMWRSAAGTSADAVAAAGLLLEAGAELDALQPIPDGGGVFMATALWWAAVQQDHLALGRHLLALGARPDACIWGVAYNGNVALLELLAAHGAAIDSRSVEGRKLLQDVLYFCLSSRRPQAVRWLLAQGADPNFTDPAGCTALHRAVAAGVRPEVLAWLLAAGADVDAKDAAGRSAARPRPRSRTRQGDRGAARPR